MSFDPDKGLLLETLLLESCLLTGKTRFKENQALVSVKPEEDETILFFSIDDQSNPKCKLRQLLWGKLKWGRFCHGKTRKNTEKFMPCFLCFSVAL